MRIYSYNKNMLDSAQELMGGLIDFAVNGTGIELEKVYEDFLSSSYPSKIQRGDSKTIMGMSGAEVVYDIWDLERLPAEKMDDYLWRTATDKSAEYWTGWILAYYQWYTSLSFAEINDIRDISSVYLMYRKFHEMDTQQFVDKMNEIYHEKNPDTRLKKLRNESGMSQRELAEQTGIPLKTIQQYEQRQKNINHAKVDYLIALSRAMSCDIELLIEKIP